MSGGFQDACRRYDMTLWVGDSGMIYGLLGERHPKPAHSRKLSHKIA
jgi:hypothetical protein